MKLDNTEMHNELNNRSDNFDPDRLLDSNSNEINDKSEPIVKITEKTEYDPDRMIQPEIGKRIENKVDGDRRQEEVGKELEKQYPESDGYKILEESTLRNKNGDTVKDKDENGSKRRVDFVVVKEDKVVSMVEVTSLTADKNKQMEKEYAIRNRGGKYVKDPETGELYKIPDNINTKIERRE